MKTVNVSMPDMMKQWIEAQVATGRYASASDYLRDLVRRDQDQKSDEQTLLNALADGQDANIEPKNLPQLLREAQAFIDEVPEK